MLAGHKPAPGPESSPHREAVSPHASLQGPRIAVFTNAYPAISHTFIRNEILALERQGLGVSRITIRSSRHGGIDASDVAEAGLTTALLGRGVAGLAIATLRRFIRSPLRFLSALRLTLHEPQRAAGAMRNLAYFIEACRLAEILEEQGVRHVHAHFGTNPAAIARLASRLTGIGYSMTVHGPDEFDAPVQLYLRQKIADAKFVVAISDFGRSQLMRWAKPADWPKIAVVRCGVADRFRQLADDTGLKSRTFVCVARLSAQKGLSVLVEAASILARDERFVLRLVGDGELRADLEQQIAANRLGDCVKLVGWRDAEGVRAELLAARALVLPSFAEGLPIVLMEALALGRPVVSTTIAGIPELVDDQNGWTVRPGSAEALAAAMRAALKASPVDLRARAAIGQERVRMHHDINVSAALLASLLRETCAAPDA